MGHHHEHPLSGAMELHPDHGSTTLRISPRDPKELRTDTDQIMFTKLGQKLLLRREGFPRLRDRPSLRRDRDKGKWSVLVYSLRRVLPRLSEPTPRPKVRSLAWAATAATHPRNPTRARLSERLSSKRDSTSLKTKTLRLSERSSASWGWFFASLA
ncbi:hypothetical protein DEO72_LG5g366 [Vigna unguiculata]|uniref:Uncharacterized protein n=1 Tax=Vigna unguiculata TaxID=3917 RepID=A0A4D6LWP9_VIGUN|nr:hypothetical protein DEO72_LG5g366 [Vigna unguiculata]